MLRIKWTRTTPNDFNQHCEELKQRLFNQGSTRELIIKHIKSVENVDWKEISKERDNTTSNQENSVSTNL